MGMQRIDQMTIIVGIAMHDNEGMRSTKEKVVYSVITPSSLHQTGCFRQRLYHSRYLSCAMAPGVDPGDSDVRKQKRG
jgi:hypothetical protein